MILAILFRPLDYFAPKKCLVFGFQLFWLWSYLMKRIPVSVVRTEYYIYGLDSAIILIFFYSLLKELTD